MASEPDLYELLGVPRNADAAAIKSAYRKMAMQYHPDRNPGDAEAEARFKAIGAAYEVLKDPQKRAAYDQYGHAAFQQGGGGGGYGAGHADFGDIGDIFETIFGSAFGGMRQGARRGADLRYDLEITLEDAFHGKSLRVRHGHVGWQRAGFSSQPIGEPASQGWTSPLGSAGVHGMNGLAVVIDTGVHGTDDEDVINDAT